MIGKNDLPEVLSPKHIQEILGLSRRGTYDLMENPPFHVARVGRLYKISKEVFFNWLEGREDD
ncbi:helix-turn-helix domain-containing protein [Bacillus sp. KH172YL63]|uniref:helix-turn-helix domain-containing protein n=1 Tax=Bacillus sp. KH172YL63 TaxID=2709784 RepID=UPI001565CB64|nr:helix-turn-helix domain-containing protein [Bacillus sp. KH172YL63]